MNYTIAVLDHQEKVLYQAQVLCHESVFDMNMDTLEDPFEELLAGLTADHGTDCIDLFVLNKVDL